MPRPRNVPGLVFSREAIRRLDRLAVEQYHIPSIVLMENAAIHLADAARRILRTLRDKDIDLHCGPGNNGGDGLAMARHLHNAGARVRLILAAPEDTYAGDAATNLAIVRAMGLPLLARVRSDARPDLLVDALLGTGLDRPVTGPMARFIGAINRARSHGVPVLAVDIPSGLDADSGRPLGVAVRATVTVTLGGLKAGFEHPGAARYLGRIVVAGIGAPRELAEYLAAGPGIDPGRPPQSRSRRRS